MDIIKWGFILWLFGYVLGIILFPFVPNSMLGWVIMPAGILITLRVLFTKIRSVRFEYYINVSVIWTLIAIVCDYFFLVMVFKPADGYYKPDVYLYYLLTFVLPLLAGWKKVASGRNARL